MSAEVQHEQSSAPLVLPAQQRVRPGRGASSPRPRPAWQRRYSRAVIANDLLSISLSGCLYALWGSADGDTVLLGSLLVTALTAASLVTARAYEPSALGQGSLEFTR